MTSADAVTSDEPKFVHPFACFGPGPYKLLGVQTTEDRELHNAELKDRGLPYTTNMSGGSCEYCMKEISDVWRFKCADGTTFKVGCDCAEKAFEHAPKAVALIQKTKNEVEKKKRHSREEKKISEGKAWIDANEAALAALPHPTEWRANKGETMLDCVRWYLQNAGTAGKIKAIKDARKALEGK